MEAAGLRPSTPAGSGAGCWSAPRPGDGGRPCAGNCWPGSRRWCHCSRRRRRSPSRSTRWGLRVYLALGDSVAAGVGAVPYVTGYPELLEARLDAGYNPAADRATPHAPVDFELVNLAKGGATTSTLRDQQLPAALKLIKDRNGDRNPRNDVEVITVTIGGNDVFAPVTVACILTATPTGCQATVDAALAGVAARLTEILSKLVVAAGPDTEVVVTTYYNPIGSCDLGRNPAAPAVADVVLEGGAVPGVLSVQAGLNDVIRRGCGKDRRSGDRPVRRARAGGLRRRHRLPAPGPLGSPGDRRRGLRHAGEVTRRPRAPGGSSATATGSARRGSR
ncbi:SGNH/GDSL hydrolase family protein [Geodermatophilus sp. SYSU D00696]